MPPPFVGKILGFTPSCIHAIRYLGADLNNGHTPVNFDGDLHRVVLLFRFGFCEIWTGRAGSGTVANCCLVQNRADKKRQRLHSVVLYRRMK
jgi:hypothetical protein